MQKDKEITTPVEVIEPSKASLNVEKSSSEPKNIVETPVENKKSNQKVFIIIGIVAILGLAAAISFFVYNNKKGAYLANKATPSPVPVATRSPKPIPHGKVGFAVSQSDKTKPQFGAGEIDPYDPEQNTIQTVRIAVKDTEDITAVSAIFKTDNGNSQPIPFTLIEGDAKMGIWQGSWTINDTYLYTYNLVLSATSSKGTSTVEATLR